MSWAATKVALNSTVGTENFKPLDQILREKIKTFVKPQDKTVTANGTYTPDPTYDALGTVTVAVPLEEKNTSGSTKSSDVSPASGYDAMSKIAFTANRSWTAVPYSTGSLTAQFYSSTNNTAKVQHNFGQKPETVLLYTSENYVFCDADDTYITVTRSQAESLGMSSDGSSVRAKYICMGD